MQSLIVILMALFLDEMFGEIRRFHPLVGFGRMAIFLEKKFNKKTTLKLRYKGVFSLVVLLIIPLLMILLLQNIIPVYIIEVLILYLAIGRKSLSQHARNIYDALVSDNLNLARSKVGLIVSRDTEKMNRQQVINAGIESVIENSSDAIFAALFWFVIAGAPGVLVYRLVNTLDAMWGYKNKRYYYFGWGAAKLDDLLNWVPARLSVLSFMVVSMRRQVWTLAFEQGLKCSSKNAGPVMAAGASALNIKLGGEAFYQGKKISKPILGRGKKAKASDILEALKLIDKSLLLWVLVLFVLSVLWEMM